TYQGGNVLEKAKLSPEKVTPEDFRLRSDSAGYKAGKDGKDLGADIDIVGPGAAYERWKKTPDYRQWLKQMGQVKRCRRNRPQFADREQTRPAGSLPPSKPSAGPAPPRRSVCAPGRCRRHSIADQTGKGERTMSFPSWLHSLRSALAPGGGRRQHRR